MPNRRYRKSGSKLARQVYKNKKKISRVANIIERKFIDATSTDVEVNTTSAIVQLTGVSEGVTTSTRIGDQVTGKSIMIRGFLDNNNHGGTNVDCICRIIVWRIRQGNGITPVIADEILTNVDVNAMQDWDKKMKNKMYYDQTFVMDTSQHSIIPFKIRLSRLNIKVRYQGTGAGLADAMDNNFMIGFFSTVAGTVNDPQATFTSRFVYEDA